FREGTTATRKTKAKAE
ncbi:hypothetical protein JCM21900_002250, partial [Sporobolomyces salmonicolor]